MSDKRRVRFGSGPFVNFTLCVCGILALIYFRDFLAAGVFICYFVGSTVYFLFKAVISLEEEVEELRGRLKDISWSLEQQYADGSGDDTEHDAASDSEADSGERTE